MIKKIATVPNYFK